MTSIQKGRDLFAARHPNGQPETEDTDPGKAGTVQSGRDLFAKFHPTTQKENDR
ncbi:hypothetical protein SCMU_27770 [Sinomonas cyclohexanicum]|uniref:Uncharacterized protein n=1 Tax=Sinomonas cyclohexanicum TaxID=322009 RepID=A0ABN6FJB2_SINCY|nr:hypothetical protein [Corynebacterium cyclohexanicum]BCT76935.1 hypothetical protein SCMU_27770 [Corynebacterium cyclohexanicum]